MQLIQLLTGIDSIVGPPDATDEVDKLENKTMLMTFATDFAVSHRMLEKLLILFFKVFDEPLMTVNLASIFCGGCIHIGEQFSQISNPRSD